jgi:hypothetical protein
MLLFAFCSVSERQFSLVNGQVKVLAFPFAVPVALNFGVQAFGEAFQFSLVVAGQM